MIPRWRLALALIVGVGVGLLAESAWVMSKDWRERKRWEKDAKRR